MGLPAKEIAELAYKIALGGIDIIKDDHGLSNQPFSPYRERVERCVEAVARANQRTGLHSIYLPNVTAAGEAAIQNALCCQVGGRRRVTHLAGVDGLWHIATTG